MYPNRRVVVLTGALWAASLPLLAKSYHAPRHDVRIAVRPGGVLEVDETFVFAFRGGPFTFAYRDLDPTHTDGISGIEAELDGRPVPVELRKRKYLRVTWRFEPSRDVERTFRLRYRVAGAVRPEESGDVLTWPVLPGDRGYRIDRSAVTIDYPPGVRPVRAPRLRGADEEARCEVPGCRFELEKVAEGRRVTLSATFPAGAVAARPPEWMASRERRDRELGASAPLGGALALTALLLGVFYIRGARQRAGASAQTAVQPGPMPSPLPPAIAGRLTGAQQGQTNLGLATLLDLARRGHVRIEDVPPERFRGADFRVSRVSGPAMLRPHESGLLEVLFEGRSDASLRLSEAGARLVARGSRFDRPLRQEMEDAGFYDPERQLIRKRLLMLSTAAFFLSSGIGAAALVAGIQLARDGGGMLWLPVGAGGAAAGIWLASLAGLIAGSLMPTLSSKGEMAARQWRGFQARLREWLKGAASPDTARFEEYLPYATAFGFGAEWLKRFRPADSHLVPAWLRSVASDDGSAAVFCTVVATSCDAGVSCDGGGGGGGGAG
jgi:hypothetical protein